MFYAVLKYVFCTNPLRSIFHNAAFSQCSTFFLNVERALSGTPVTEKYLTVCGAVREPRTLKVPIGVPFSAVVDACRGVRPR